MPRAPLILAVWRLRTLRQWAAHDIAVFSIVFVCVQAGLAPIGAALAVFLACTLPFGRWMWRRPRCGRAGTRAPEAVTGGRALLRTLAFLGTAIFFTLCGCGTILVLTGQVHASQLAVSGITGVGGAIGVMGVFGTLRPPGRW